MTQVTGYQKCERKGALSSIQKRQESYWRNLYEAEKYTEQAGAELCQALVKVDLVAVFILQLNFRFGKHWKSEFSHV